MTGLASSPSAISPSTTALHRPGITSSVKPLQSSHTSRLVAQPAALAGQTSLTAGKTPISPGPAKTPVALKPSALKKSATETQPQASLSTPTHVMTMPAVVSPAPTAEPPAIMSMTTKEWVIPPRPKPGRKPATDTPPTKRKAQNRAAQRAFRERRAARVGELEEQLDQQRDEQDQKENEYKGKIRDLEMELQSFKSRYALLESMLEKERRERLQAETRLEALRRQQGEEKQVFRTTSLPGPHYGSSHQGQHQHQAYTRQSVSYEARDRSGSNTLAPIANLHKVVSTVDEAPQDLTCGHCEPSGRCACVEEVLKATCTDCGPESACKCLGSAAATLNQGMDLKRSASPTNTSVGHKRSRTTHDLGQELKATDFTHARESIEKSDALATSEPPSLDASFVKDACGFCSDGTYCVCADTAMATAGDTPAETLPPIAVPQVQQFQTPPPSDTDVVSHSQPHVMEMTADGAVKLPRRKPSSKPTAQTQVRSRGCGSGGPGTCEQCRRDPKSGLFCRLMAAKLDKEGGGGSGGCCGGKGGEGGGCCKSKGSSDAAARATAAASAPATKSGEQRVTLPSLPSLGLSCAEAYQTLSSHRYFKRAEDDIGSWLPLLKAAPRQNEAGARQNQGGRMMPIEVEAASIMSVLKDFDVRFGREA